MLIDFEELIKKYKINISGVIHVGGHVGEEIPIYKKFTNNIHIFEPLKSCYDKIDNSVNKYNVALGENEKQTQIYVANNNQSSSILKPKEHLTQHPDVFFTHMNNIKVLPLDSFKINECNFMNIDVQGYELNVLKGSTNTLKYIDYIYTEINTSEIYENCALVQDLDSFLTDYERVETEICGNHGWGDAFYINRKKL